MRAPRMALALACSGVSIDPGLALAQQGGNIDLQSFRPAMDSRGYITLNASGVLGHRELSFGLVTNWGTNVLSFHNGDNTYEVQNILTPPLGGAYGLRVGGLELEIGASIPFSIMSGDRGPDSDGGTDDDPNDDDNFQFEGQGLGDIALHTKLRLLNTSRGAKLGVAVIGSLYLPTASERDAWLGADSVTPQAMLVIDRELGRLEIAVNAGVRYRGSTSRFIDDMSQLPDGTSVPMTNQVIEVGATLPFGAGIAYALAPDRFDVIGEVFGALPFSGQNYAPLEAIAGVKLYLARNSFLTIGGGVGLTPSSGGTPDARAFVGIVFEPNIGDRDGDGLKDDLDKCPDSPEDFDDFEDADGCPELDNDRDTIVDEDDMCPNEPEDRDHFEDEDGCPEGDTTDRDNDTIVDEDDECPDDPEDFDAFEDADGCPDRDNDGDRLLDIDDLCPDDPEDIDEWEDDDGCPDRDNDRDRILDTDDECKNEPETYNTVDDDDGCPDRGPVEIGDGKLIVLDDIYFQFNSAVIKEKSHPILKIIAETISLNPDLLLIEVQGHTDERGKDAYNLWLSQRRAEAVVEFLVDQGVDAARLGAQGYGETDPKDRASNEKAWAANRRVEFVIVRRGHSQ